MRLDYDARVRKRWATAMLTGVLIAWTPPARSQEEPPKKTEPAYEDTFAGPIVELTKDKVTVSRTILGKTEKHTFLIKPDTRIEGKLKVKVKVTVGFISTDDGDIARLIVVRPNNGKR